jgi:uncharacterized damage-inducible protein DinB
MLSLMKARDTFLQMWEREFQTTCRVFKAFPADRLDVKPHERSRSVRDLAWQCVGDERVIGMVVEGKNDLRNVPKGPPLPETMDEILAEYENVHRDSYAKVSRLSEEEFDRAITFTTFAGSGQLEQPEVLWGNLLDQVHHRGQLTVYLRQAGGKVPSIYGPSGDEAMRR